MTTHVQSWILLAAREEMHRVWGRFDHEKPALETTHIVIAVVLVSVVVITVIVTLIRQKRESRTFRCDSNIKLFWDLCAAHNLRRRGRRLLKRLAHARGLTNPALLFVEPQHFDAASLPVEWRESASELERIRERLFG